MGEDEIRAAARNHVAGLLEWLRAGLEHFTQESDQDQVRHLTKRIDEELGLIGARSIVAFANREAPSKVLRPAISDEKCDQLSVEFWKYVHGRADQPGDSWRPEIQYGFEMVKWLRDEGHLGVSVLPESVSSRPLIENDFLQSVFIRDAGKKFRSRFATPDRELTKSERMEQAMFIQGAVWGRDFGSQKYHELVDEYHGLIKERGALAPEFDGEVGDKIRHQEERIKELESENARLKQLFDPSNWVEVDYDVPANWTSGRVFICKLVEHPFAALEAKGEG